MSPEGRGRLDCSSGGPHEGRQRWSKVGAAESDIVLLVMNRRGMDRLLESKFTIGGAAQAAAGPVGRSIESKTDAKMPAQILCWSRSRVVFAGMSLDGATMRNDLDENRELYGKRLKNKQILTRRMLLLHSARPLITLLNQYTERERRS